MEKKSLPLSKVYRLLEPCPVIMMVDFEPPLVAVVMGQEDYSFEILKKTKECVINIPTVELIEKAVKIGETTGAKIDKQSLVVLGSEETTYRGTVAFL